MPFRVSPVIDHREEILDFVNKEFDASSVMSVNEIRTFSEEVRRYEKTIGNALPSFVRSEATLVTKSAACPIAVI